MTKKHLFQNGLALLVCLFLFAGTSFAQTKTATITVTSSCDWPVPNEIEGTPINVVSVTFEAWGGGGAGGYSWTRFLITPGGGGGGAAYAKSATLTNVSVGDEFTITVGAPGTAIGNDPDSYTVTNGGTSSVMKGGNFLVKAVGGKSVQGVSNTQGAAGGSSDDCEGEVTYSGGRGGNADKGILNSGAYCVSGSGGGAGGPLGNGSDAENSYYNLNPFNDLPCCGQITGYRGSGGGQPAGNGASGLESQIFGNGGWGNAQGNAGENFGGGGSGAISNGVSWGDANGGQGGSGAVRITIVYTENVESIEVSDASTSICSGAEFDIPLDITVQGFDLSDLLVNPAMGDPGDLVIENANVSFNNEDNKWHFTGSASNNNENNATQTFNGITVTVTSPNNSDLTKSIRVSLTVYGKLNGGVIAENQLVCHEMSIQQLTSVQDATGGSGNGSYKWIRWDEIDVIDGVIDWGAEEWSDYIDGANAPTYLPTLQGTHFYAREFDDSECGKVYALGENNRDYLQVTTVDPLSFNESYSSEDTICSNESYSKTLSMGFESPVVPTGGFWGYGDIELTWHIYYQKSTDKGATWENLTGLVWENYHVNLTPSDFSDGDDIWYRAALKINDCDSVPSNAIYKLHVKKVPDYTDQFPDVNITLWYGACDTNIAVLNVPELDPEPAEIVRADEYTRVGPGEYTILWNMKPDPECDIYTRYEQKVIVKYPACGTLEEDYIISVGDEQYKTIRIDCECWLAENLRTEAGDGTYYNEDEDNKDFGRLYSWASAMGDNVEATSMTGAKYIQGVCPEGWSVPSLNQYIALIGHGVDNLKSAEEGAWLPGKGGNNSTGFNMKGAGLYEAGQYQRLLGYADIWTTATVSGNSTVGVAVEARYDCDDMMPKEMNKENKISVRCVRIEPIQ